MPTSSADPHQLQRFVDAQQGAYEAALSELRNGRKASHWMWFVFPQLTGLGDSEMSRRFAIRSLAEARAYLDHPILGSRLRECLAALQDLPPTSAERVLGSIDAAKLKSSLTLFAAAAPQDRLFDEALDRWFDGERDGRTILRLP